MLGGRISNQDEDEVEDELEELEAEIAGIPLPAVPTSELPNKEMPNVPKSNFAPRDRAKARQRGREMEAEATLA